MKALLALCAVLLTALPASAQEGKPNDAVVPVHHLDARLKALAGE